VCLVKRPPVEDILSFLQSENWIVQNMFSGLDLAKVAHGLAGKVCTYFTLVTLRYVTMRSPWKLLREKSYNNRC